MQHDPPDIGTGSKSFNLWTFFCGWIKHQMQNKWNSTKTTFLGLDLCNGSGKFKSNWTRISFRFCECVVSIVNRRWTTRKCFFQLCWLFGGPYKGFWMLLSLLGRRRISTRQSGQKSSMIKPHQEIKKFLIRLKRFDHQNRQLIHFNSFTSFLHSHALVSD